MSRRGLVNTPRRLALKNPQIAMLWDPISSRAVAPKGRSAAPAWWRRINAPMVAAAVATLLCALLYWLHATGVVRIHTAQNWEERPVGGRLGGMRGWPGSEWTAAPDDNPPGRAEWRTLPAEARHTFTHFHLHLTVKTALVPMDRAPERGMFVEADAFDPDNLPTVMRKAHALTKTK